MKCNEKEQHDAGRHKMREKNAAVRKKHKELMPKETNTNMQRHIEMTN